MKHHYIPVFYLKAWVGPDQRVCEFSRPHRNVVVPRRVHPSGTGYVRNLYALPGYLNDRADSIERYFFSPVDSQATDAHRKMLHHSRLNFTADERSSWARFITSLLLRSPRDVRLLINMMRSEFFVTDEATEQRYLQDREAADPQTLNEFLRQTATQDYIDRGSLHILTQLIDHQGVGNHIVSMQWHVFSISPNGHQFLTSDRPVIMTNGMDRRESYLMLPISPTKAFVAVNDDDRLEAFRSADQSVFIRSVNRTLVSFATQYVWGRNDSARAFVQSEMASRNAPSLMDMMAGRRRYSP